MAGCNVLRKEGISLRTSRALVSGCRSIKFTGLDPALDPAVSLGMGIKPSALTSSRVDASETTQGRTVSLIRLNSRRSFLLSKRRRSEMERPRATSTDMVVDRIVGTARRALTKRSTFWLGERRVQQSSGCRILRKEWAPPNRSTVSFERPITLVRHTEGTRRAIGAK